MRVHLCPDPNCGRQFSVDTVESQSLHCPACGTAIPAARDSDSIDKSELHEPASESNDSDFHGSSNDETDSATPGNSMRQMQSGIGDFLKPLLKDFTEWRRGLTRHIQDIVYPSDSSELWIRPHEKSPAVQHAEGRWSIDASGSCIECGKVVSTDVRTKKFQIRDFDGTLYGVGAVVLTSIVCIPISVLLSAGVFVGGIVFVMRMGKRNEVRIRFNTCSKHEQQGSLPAARMFRSSLVVTVGNGKVRARILDKSRNIATPQVADPMESPQPFELNAGPTVSVERLQLAESDESDSGVNQDADAHDTPAASTPQKLENAPQQPRIPVVEVDESDSPSPEIRPFHIAEPDASVHSLSPQAGSSQQIPLREWTSDATISNEDDTDAAAPRETTSPSADKQNDPETFSLVAPISPTVGGDISAEPASASTDDSESRAQPAANRADAVWAVPSGNAQASSPAPIESSDIPCPHCEAAIPKKTVMCPICRKAVRSRSWAGERPRKRRPSVPRVTQIYGFGIWGFFKFIGWANAVCALVLPCLIPMMGRNIDAGSAAPMILIVWVVTAIQFWLHMKLAAMGEALINGERSAVYGLLIVFLLVFGGAVAAAASIPNPDGSPIPFAVVGLIAVLGLPPLIAAFARWDAFE